MVNIKIIIGSVRPGRFGDTAARWLHGLAADRTDAQFEIIDLAEIKLPFLDEPEAAMSGQYSHDHTKAWSARIAPADGFVFVSSEYNHSYSPALKNAIDFLYAEWNHKPVAFASYGVHAGGARSVEHLRGVAAQVKMYDLFEHVIMPKYYTQFDEQGKWRATDEQVTQAQEMLDAIVFWAGQMKRARAELPVTVAT